MRHLTAYAQSQDVTLDAEQAFAELYLRLARWTAEILGDYSDREPAVNDRRIERCVALLGYMSHAIDLSSNFGVASAVLSLHRFAISALVKATAERNGAALEGLSRLFITLSEIFSAIRAGKQAKHAF
jgi:flagellin-specific chaperone FliS